MKTMHIEQTCTDDLWNRIELRRRRVIAEKWSHFLSHAFNTKYGSKGLVLSCMPTATGISHSMHVCQKLQPSHRTFENVCSPYIFIRTSNLGCMNKVAHTNRKCMTPSRFLCLLYKYLVLIKRTMVVPLCMKYLWFDICRISLSFHPV